MPDMQRVHLDAVARVSGGEARQKQHREGALGAEDAGGSLCPGYKTSYCQRGGSSIAGAPAGPAPKPKPVAGSADGVQPRPVSWDRGGLAHVDVAPQLTALPSRSRRGQCRRGSLQGRSIKGPYGDRRGPETPR